MENIMTAEVISMLIDIVIGLSFGVGGVLLKTFLPQLNPLLKELVVLVDRIPHRNEQIMELAKTLGQDRAIAYLTPKLITHEEK